MRLSNWNRRPPVMLSSELTGEISCQKSVYHPRIEMEEGVFQFYVRIGTFNLMIHGEIWIQFSKIPPFRIRTSHAEFWLDLRSQNIPRPRIGTSDWELRQYGSMGTMLYARRLPSGISNALRLSERLVLSNIKSINIVCGLSKEILWHQQSPSVGHKGQMMELGILCIRSIFWAEISSFFYFSRTCRLSKLYM